MYRCSDKGDVLIGQAKVNNNLPLAISGIEITEG